MSYATSSLGYYGGTFFGGGSASSNGRTSNVYGSNVASSANLTRVSRDITQGYNQNIEIINKYLEQGNIDQAFKLYNSLFESVKNTSDGYGYELDDGQIASIVNDAYLNSTGSTFIDSIDQSTHSPFVTGLLEGIPIVGWFTNGNSNSEAYSKLTGTEPPEIDKNVEAAGVGVVAGIAGLASVALIGGPVGWAIAGGIAANAVLTHMIKK